MTAAGTLPPVSTPHGGGARGPVKKAAIVAPTSSAAESSCHEGSTQAATCSTWAGTSTTSWAASDSTWRDSSAGGLHRSQSTPATASRHIVMDLRAGLRMPGPNATEEEYHAWATRLWNRLDRDHSGYITRQELQCEEFYNVIKMAIGGDTSGVNTATYTRAQMNIQEALSFCLRKADSSGDGILSFDEFNSFLRTLSNPEKRKHNAHLIFSLFDVNLSGAIDRNEFREMYRFYIGRNPTENQLEEEWQRLAAAGDGEVATLKQYIRWLQTSPNPIFRAHAPPAEAAKPKRRPESTRSKLASMIKPSRCRPIEQCPKWQKNFVSGLNPGHVNDSMPQDRRDYFMRSQTETQLRRFYEQHEGFEQQLAKLDAPPPVKPYCALWPKVLSTEGGTPLTLPHRHSPGGIMREHATGRVAVWEDYWCPPLRFRVNANARDRPMPIKATFSEPDRMAKPPTQRYGPNASALKAMRAPKVHPDREVAPTRFTMLEAEPW